VIVDDGGNFHVSGDNGSSFTKVSIEGFGPLTGVIQTESGDLLLTGARGVSRLALSKLDTGTKP